MTCIKPELEGIIKDPLILLTITDQQLRDELNNLIPYSTGFEIECDKSPLYNEANFKFIPDLVELDNDSNEQRYRIPNGIQGILCLNHISKQLKFNSLLNLGSGIHYHVNCTDVLGQPYRGGTEYFVSEVKYNSDWILKELDTWGYKGGYNKKQVCGASASWVRFNSEFNTIEFRCGEMTFDYMELLNFIVSANSIVRRIKDKYINGKQGHTIPINLTQKPEFQNPDIAKILEYRRSILINDGRILKLQRDIELLNEKKSKIVKEEEANKADPLIEIRSQLRKRIHRIGGKDGE